jgi:hypothetical protein
MRQARSRRRRIAGAALAALVVLIGCGGSSLRHGAAPGDAVSVDGVSYKVTRVAVLDRAAANDRALLAGTRTSLPPGLEWLGVFVQATNTAGSPRPATGAVAVMDGAHHVFHAVRPARGNAYAYRAVVLGPHDGLPSPDSPAAFSPEQGSVLLFEVPPGDVRPGSGLELRLYDPGRPADFASVRLERG